jgi:glucokinase
VVLDGAGKPVRGATRVSAAATEVDVSAVLAFDLGGTRLKSGAVGEDGVVLDLGTTQVQGQRIVDLVLKRADVLNARHHAAACGVSVPGIVDSGRVVSLAGKHPGIENVDIAAAVTERIGVPTVVVNDAIAYAVGEATAGAARESLRTVVVTIGTGVGVAVIEDGAVLGGGTFGGGMLGGQIPIADDSAHTDTSGRRGTIEALCAAPRLADSAGAAYASVEDVLDAAANAAEDARASVAEWRGHLVRALVALAHAHAPTLIVVGGGPAANPALLDGVESRVNEALYRGYSVMVRRAALGDSAALVGVAHLARQAAAAR